MALLSYLFQPAKGAVTAALLTSILSGLSSAALVGIISQQLTRQQPITATTIGSFGGLILLVMVTDLLAKWLLMRLSMQSTYRLRLQLVRRILNTPLRQLEIIGNPTLVAALVEDIRTLSLALHQLPSVSIGITIIVGCTLYLTWLSPVIFALLAVLSLPTLFIYRHLDRKAKATLRATLALRDKRDAYFEGLTQGAKELQLNRRRRQFFRSQLLEPTLLAMQQQGVTTRMYHALAQSWSQSAYFIFILLIMSLAFLAGIELTILANYAVTALYMKSSINQVLLALPHWTEATLALQKIEALQLALDEEDGCESESAAFPRPRHLHLTLSAITHTYTTDMRLQPFILGPLSLQVAAGELLFITGANGSGKSTLLKVLAGLYVPESGAITLNQSAVTERNRHQYREHFSVVFSDFYLFEQLLGSEDLPIDKQALTYLTKLQLHHKVTINQSRLSTLDLSQGQRKRLALLTAYLEDRPIYLFDEWAANQDPAFKELFYRQLLPELVARGKLVIAITHDEQYFALADRVLRLEDGRLVEETVSAAY